MRVTESKMLELAGQATAAARERVTSAHQDITSGVRVHRPSDGVADWVEGHRAQVRGRYLEAGETAMARSRDRLARTDQIFGGLGRILDRTRELAVQARSDTVTTEGRHGLAVEVQSLRAEALRLVNEQSSDGEHLLAGTSGATKPFDHITGKYAGDDVLRSIAVDVGLTQVVGSSGAPLTASAGVDLFASLDSFVTGLETDDTKAIETAIDELATVGDQVVDARVRIGSRIRALDSAEETHQELRLVVAERLSRAVEADAVAAASQFSQELSSLEAARTVATRIISLVTG